MSEEGVTEAVIVTVETVCKNCTYLRVRRGKPYSPVVKHGVSENYTCGSFKSKQT